VIALGLRLQARRTGVIALLGRWSLRRCWRRNIAHIPVLALALIFPGTVRAQSPVISLADGRDGTIFFASSTPADLDQYLETTQAPETVVSGVLRLPAGSERVPAVVLSHSAGGVSADRDLAWAERFTSIGIAVFVVDSFTSRGVKGFANQPDFAAGVADVYAALRLLATHPRIDPTRVALMGFSRGGSVALTAALDPVRRIGAPDGARFAAHVALYPGCNTRFLAGKITGAPMLMLLGGADDLTPPEPCRRYGEWFRNMGAAIKVVAYPGAYHLFDGTEPVHFIAQAATAGNCDTEYDLEARVLRRTDTSAVLADNEIGTYFSTCSSRGFHIGGDSDARAGAKHEIAAFFKTRLQLPDAGR
jgi:dienelactone hydrolase